MKLKLYVLMMVQRIIRWKLLLEAASKDHRISVYTQKNSGLSVTRIGGAELANGKIYLFYGQR